MSAKSTPAQESASQGYWLGLTLRPGLPVRAEVTLMRDLEDHLTDRGLRIGGGTQRHLFIESLERDVSLVDQIDLVDWCLLRTPVTQIAVTDLTSARLSPPVAAKVLHIDRWDLATLGVGLLYRIGRITAAQYAEILGGFVTTADGELFA